MDPGEIALRPGSSAISRPASFGKPRFEGGQAQAGNSGKRRKVRVRPKLGRRLFAEGRRLEGVLDIGGRAGSVNGIRNVQLVRTFRTLP